ncbi:hypothetical protein PPYC1_13805 [Paenibacillus polymyxa]|uniref:hypothetical protein n=1 Tax=Paenibacillus polymyxa TaxID=1406 RepID=UPI0008FCDB72|nr:hypothetical protein [Paenibacillus polymyxa]APB71367.1 hypothetical protein PPYC1_13805 [Paenibacillus polymyxa]
MRKKLVLTVAASLALGMGIFSYSYSNSAAISKQAQHNANPIAMKDPSSILRTGEIEANHAIFTNADDAEAQSDAVVKVIATGESKNVIENFDWGPSGRTETKVKVTKVYKDSIKKEIGSELVAFEPTYVIQDKQGSIRMNYEDYTPMQEGKEYILFLVWSEPLGGYWINALEQGKYDLSGTDAEEKTLQATNNQYNELKKSVLEKYK